MVNFKVEGVYDYNSPEEDDLTFKAGQIITVTEEEGPDWYVGEYIDDVGNHHSGLFPTNFVKKYEPAPPPRPNRASRYKPLEHPAPDETSEPEPAPAPAEQDASTPPKPQHPPVDDYYSPAAKAQASPTSPTFAYNAKPREPPQEASDSPRASPAPSGGRKPPPPVAAKSNNFRDRIAAFNSPAAAPLQPFKPGGGPPSTFIKKPFVAPPPSRNAYVAPPREAPPVKTAYRREDLPEIAERQAQDQRNAERAGLAATSSTDGDGEDQPKPTTLRERIALLQRQQAEQAERSAALLKEKPKKPPPVKKRTESHDGRPNDLESPALEKVTTAESVPASLDNARPPRSSHGVKSPDAVLSHREFLSDANDADQSGAGDTEDAEGTSTSVEEEDVQAERAAVAPPVEKDVGDKEGAAEEAEEEEDEMDAETRRKLELRERMAKMSGGMGMAGMFGGPRGMPPPPPKKKPVGLEKRSTDESINHPQQRVAMLPMSGMPIVKSPDSEDTQLGEEREDMTPYPHTSPSHQVQDESDTENAPTYDRPPAIPQEKRPVPPPIPTADRPVPPPFPSTTRPAPPPQLRSPSPGSESGDEMTDSALLSTITSPRSPPTINTKRISYIGLEPISPTSPDRRMPPLPLGSPTFPLASGSRPPPPPPPTGPPFRPGTMDSISRRIDRNEGETDYEGDYDTDIASGATHKDALRSHAREPSFDDNTVADETSSVRSPTTPHGVPPPPPSLQRGAPPPPPQQLSRRVSVDTPRAAPPLLPTSPLARNLGEENENEYDPYNYVGGVPPQPPRGIPPPPQSQTPLQQNRPPPPPPMAPPTLRAVESSGDDDEDDLYSAPPPRKSHDRPPPPPPMTQVRAVPPPSAQERGPPPPPPQKYVAPRPPPPEQSQSYQPPPPIARKSQDVNRALLNTRGSADQPRPPVNVEFIASDIDLGHSSHWWTQPNMPPPALQNRRDILLEMHEAREGNTVQKSIKVLYMDYSQTIITARFEANNVSDVQLEQVQQPPPNNLRQDQLEAAHVQFGLRIAKDVETKGFKAEKALGDGTPQGLITFVLSSHPTALKPVSTRAFGSLVYANLANASTQQYDEIRPGDIISFRNASFKGKHGTIHKSYSTDVGRPDHVGVVVEWDGSKKKVRVWEQGREGMSKKVKEVSWKMGDLRSGEVRVWRVMSRSWVGW